MNELRASFRPEFLNRLDEIIMFKPLTKENLGGIIDNLLDGLRRRLAERSADGGIKLDVTEAAKSLIIEKGYDRYTARVHSRDTPERGRDSDRKGNPARQPRLRLYAGTRRRERQSCLPSGIEAEIVE